MKRSGFKQRSKGLKPISDKRKKYRASAEGQAGLEYMRRVKMLPCVICNAPPPSDAHHCICDRYGARKSSDLDTIPLCKAHHQDGPDAIHNGKASWVAKHGPDHAYLKIVADMLRKEM